MLTFLTSVLQASWEILNQASLYILFGLLVGGLLKVFLSPAYVAAHLGSGRYRSVFKAALLGIPIPLCSCGVLPAAASLKKQGANNGATTAFLISTPESGVDSISITWALLDPLMTIARPVSAFVSAFSAGLAENFFNPPDRQTRIEADLSCPIDNCCDGKNCPPEKHRKHHSFFDKCKTGVGYAGGELWSELVGWFFIGILLAGVITVLVPDDMISHYLGGGISSMLLMLLVGIPLYICATASTPIAAALIMKGVSPGTALVFLLVGPATNITSLSVLIGLLGKRAIGLYLLSIALISVLCGLLLDAIYLSLGVSAVAIAGQAVEVIPRALILTATLLLTTLSIKPLYRTISGWFSGDTSCGCSDSSCATANNYISSSSIEHGENANDCGCGSSCRTSTPVPSPLTDIRPGDK